MRKQIISMLLIGVATGVCYAQNDYDDIYYNPKKETKKEVQKETNYIADFDNLDVDIYNRRGSYYESPIDTIGLGAESADDFYYTQMIQKYYNPTIVVDNADLLEDILANSYGNVDVIYEGLTPVFGPVYNSYYTWGNPWAYSWNYAGWNLSYNPWYWGNPWGWYDPWAWNPGPAWWYPGLGYGWYWGYTWGYGHPRPPRPDMAYRPNGNRPVGPGAGWSDNTRPGGGVGNYNGGHHTLAGRPGSNAKPASWGSTSGQSTTNHHRQYSTGRYDNLNGTRNQNKGYQQVGSGNRQLSTGVNSNKSSNSHRTSSSGFNTNSSSQSNSYNHNSTTNYNSKSNSGNRSSYGSGSSGTHRSSGSSGSSRSGGGGGRGRHR